MPPKPTSLHEARTLLARLAMGESPRWHEGRLWFSDFEEGSFDFVYCSAEFKNFSEPVNALNEIYCVLRPGGEAVIADLRKDASLDEIDGMWNKADGA
jgi:ubiquinone/menaquinone biosynthesis C-methylase UbiE